MDRLKRGVRIHLQSFIIKDSNTGKGQTMANRYIYGKTEEYFGKQAWGDRWRT